MYIYIYRERERYMYIHMYMYIHVHIYIYIYKGAPLEFPVQGSWIGGVAFALHAVVEKIIEVENKQ